MKCRKKIQPDVFKYLNQRLIEEFYTDNEASVKLWKGYRLLSVDGSCITLPDTKELAKEYGCAKNQTANKLKLEYFSGYSKQTVLQDFYATVFVSNIQSLTVGEVNDELREKTGKKYDTK